MTRAGLKRAIAATYRDVQDHHTLQVAAALSYYSILAVFPGLIFLSAVMGLIPLTDLFARTLDVMARVLPPDTMRFVQSMLINLVGANHKAWLSFSMLGIIWIASSAFDAVIEALDIAYEVKATRPLWKTRLLALLLGGVCVVLWIVALAVMIVGPEFGDWLATRIPVSQVFVVLWPLIHWSIAISFTVLAVEIVYFLASQCPAALSPHPARCASCRDVLDRAFLPALAFISGILPTITEPTERWPGSSHSLTWLLLERVRVIARSGN